MYNIVVIVVVTLIVKATARCDNVVITSLSLSLSLVYVFIFFHHIQRISWYRPIERSNDWPNSARRSDLWNRTGTTLAGYFRIRWFQATV